METIIENTDVVLSQTELCTIVSNKTKIDENKVKLVLDSFIELFLKKLKLS